MAAPSTSVTPCLGRVIEVRFTETSSNVYEVTLSEIQSESMP